MLRTIFGLLAIVTLINGFPFDFYTQEPDYNPRENRVPMAIPDNWDSVYSYHFDYYRISNFTDVVSRRINFRSTVHLRQDPDNINSIFAFFTETSYDHEDAYHRNKNFPVVIEGIHLPFRILFHSSGLVHEISTDPDDSDLSAKYKKTFASVIQFDWKFINEKRIADKEFDYVFISPEDTIFGSCNVLNNVTQIGEGRILRKRLLMDTCLREKFPKQKPSIHDVNVEFKFRSSRNRQFHWLQLNGTEYVKESDSYSRLEQLVEFRENVKSRQTVHANRLTINRVITL
ncbi:uncharacterized protein LOC134828984 [Culicoides brevitarsis]|uniref:uncharacterized protein LOC134828984 n=1 Tax=Culicoides brevitarsis TaxID=469753 RepID=UPI00307C6E91